jgi:hypothetical protein
LKSVEHCIASAIVAITDVRDFRRFKLAD